MLAAASLPCGKAPSNLDAKVCYGQLAEQTDRQMAAQWKITLKKLRAEDVDNRRERLNKPSMADGLLDSQRAWLQYRKAQCNMISDQAAGGTGYSELGARCEIAFNLQRTAELKRRADGFLKPSFE
ncbi:hypothetical protein SAQ01S_33550 [Sphingomonas aquatilis NBRC 16722]|nr:hypothetical protein SAQ01S_33550 [Sphingomonas aquatilis NBRC 16722]